MFYIRPAAGELRVELTLVAINYNRLPAYRSIYATADKRVFIFSYFYWKWWLGLRRFPLRGHANGLKQDTT